MPGWLGFGTKDIGYAGIPHWFSFDEDEKHIVASIKPSRLQFEAKMDHQKWISWKTQFKKIA
ncbi:hypothetical protein [Aquimarina sp. SS2-1]|uniref:hypothetical protein n=1 Tax=Aquimarina besae TaxID=3342247 RepID=UPI0036721DD3